MTGQAREWTFALVDLAGFTALTETHGEDRAADLAVEFAELATARLAPGDRLVKTIGDAVLLASPTPRAGLLLVQGVLETSYRATGFPLSRAGLHHGPAAERGDDLFGAAVNLTARVAAQASGGQILATAAVAAAAAEEGLPTRALGAFGMRNVAEAVELWDVRLVEVPSAEHVDPVCRMTVDPGRAAGRLTAAGREFWFCSLECAAKFAASPERFTG